MNTVLLPYVLTLVLLLKNLNRIAGKVLTLKLPDKLQPYGLYVYYVVHICDFGMLRVKQVNLQSILDVIERS